MTVSNCKITNENFARNRTNQIDCGKIKCYDFPKIRRIRVTKWNQWLAIVLVLAIEAPASAKLGHEASGRTYVEVSK